MLNFPLLAAAANTPGDYLPVVLLLLIGGGLSTVMLGASWLAGKWGKHNPAKDSAYECGIEAVGHAHTRFSVKFYLVAVLFILFDIEVVFLYPWAVYFGGGEPGIFGDVASLQRFLFAEMLVFLIILFVGWYWVVKKKALDWEDA